MNIVVKVKCDDCGKMFIARSVSQGEINSGLLNINLYLVDVLKGCDCKPEKCEACQRSEIYKGKGDYISNDTLFILRQHCTCEGDL